MASEPLLIESTYKLYKLYNKIWYNVTQTYTTQPREEKKYCHDKHGHARKKGEKKNINKEIFFCALMWMRQERNMK